MRFLLLNMFRMLLKFAMLGWILFILVAGLVVVGLRGVEAATDYLESSTTTGVP